MSNDDNDRWQAHFLVLLDCRCGNCGRRAETDDLLAKYQSKHRREHPNSLFRFCVKAANRVSELGWMMDGDQKPHCPECWAQLQVAPAPPC